MAFPEGEILPNWMELYIAPDFAGLAIPPSANGLKMRPSGLSKALEVAQAG
jgi:hypothetical protein